MSALPDLSTHKEVKVEMDIQAPADVVWRVLTDFPAYTTWNPYIYPASGEPVDGTHLDLVLHGGQQIHFTPLVVDAVPNQKLVWMDRLPLGVLERVLTWQITPLDTDRVHLVASELFRGIALPASSGLPGDAAGGLTLMMKTLRDRAELLAYTRPQTPPLRVSLPNAPGTTSVTTPQGVTSQSH
jgi:uncharacterized protein YndB with AHSA1/START domain